MSEWISVNDRPLILPDEGDTWEITKEGSQRFIARIPIEHNGVDEEWMGWCYIEDGTGNLCYVGDSEDVGWRPEDVTHYILMPLPEPPKP